MMRFTPLSLLLPALVLLSCQSEGERDSGVEGSRGEVLEEVEVLGSLEFSPGVQAIKVEAGEETVESVVEVINKGTEVVTITQLESRCTCLSVDIDRRELSPGSKATITGVFSTAKLSGSSEKMITVETDESETRKAFLKVRLNIDPLYEIREAMTEWKIGEEPLTKTVTFEVKRKRPIRILKAESMRDEVSCELVTVEEGRLYELKLTPKSTDRTLLGIVKIETDCEIEAQANTMAYFSIQQ